MLSLFIEEAYVKEFMNRLLREPIFDTFEVRGVDIAAETTISVTGEKEPGTFITWLQAKPLITAIIKSGPRPRFMKIIFAADEKTTVGIHDNAQVLFLNMTYDNGQLTFTTACAQKEFIMDKSMDTQWDAWVLAFFNAQNIAIKEKTE